MKKTFRIRNKLLRTNLRKVIRYQGNKYTLGDLLRLLKEQGSFVKVSEITHIPYPRLYFILTKYFGKGINKIKKQVGFIKAKDRGYTYSLKKIVRLFKKYGFLPDVSRATGIPTTSLRNILIKEFGMGLHELRRKLKGRKTYFRDSDKSSFRYQQVKDAYERLGTLEKTGKELGLTRQRVSQILLKGKRIGLFSYQRKGGDLKTLKRELTREILIRDIELLYSKTKICLKYNINEKKLKSLFRHFGIDFKEYQRATRVGKYIQWYSKIVDDLGYHPATTELNTRPEWNKVWKGIGRYWGNFENFRKEFGIEKPKHRIPPRFAALIERRMAEAETNRKNIIELFKTKGTLSLKEVAATLGLKNGNVYCYLAKFKRDGIIGIVGKGNLAKYTLLNNG